MWTWPPWSNPDGAARFILVGRCAALFVVKLEAVRCVRLTRLVVLDLSTVLIQRHIVQALSAQSAAGG